MNPQQHQFENHIKSSIIFKYETYKNTQNGLQMQIQAAQNTAQPPLILSGTGTSYLKLYNFIRFRFLQFFTLIKAISGVVM